MRPLRETARRGAVAGAVAAGVLLAAACSAGTPGTAEKESAPRTTPPPSTASTPGTHVLAAAYLKIAEAGNRRLDIDFDRLEETDARNLARSQADLRDAAATERLFDQQLAAIRFPPPIEAVARTLIHVNEARAGLATTAAASTSLDQLQAYRRQLKAMDVPVEREVTSIRSMLGLPPPETD